MKSQLLKQNYKENLEYLKRWRLNNPDKLRIIAKRTLLKHPIAKLNQRLKQYGITYEGYLKLLKLQNNSCAICKALKNVNKRFKRFAVDHNHDTKKIRGLLCNNCNFALGYLKDNPLFLAQAILYLTETGNLQFLDMAKQITQNAEEIEHLKNKIERQDKNNK